MLYHFIKFIIFISFLHTSECNLFGAKDTFTVNLHYVKECKNYDNKFNLHLHLKKFNRTHFGLDGNLTLYEDFGSQYKLDIEVRTWGDGGWKKNALHYVLNNACDQFHRLFGEMWEQFLDAAKASHTCPVKKGFYSLHNFHMDLSKVPIIIKSGRLYAILIIKKKNVVETCVDVEGDVIPTIK